MTPVLQNGDATITIVDPTAGTIHIAVRNERDCSKQDATSTRSSSPSVTSSRRCGSA